MDDRVVIPVGIRDEVINALHFGHPGLTKMEMESKIFWWPNMTEDIKEKQKRCIACRNAGKNLKSNTIN